MHDTILLDERSASAALSGHATCDAGMATPRGWAAVGTHKRPLHPLPAGGSPEMGGRADPEGEASRKQLQNKRRRRCNVTVQNRTRVLSRSVLRPSWRE